MRPKVRARVSSSFLLFSSLLFVSVPLSAWESDGGVGRGRDFDVYKEILRQNPNSRQALHQLALLLFEQGEYEAARSYIDKLTALQRADVEVIALRGRILTGNGLYKEAEQLYLKQLSQHPYQADMLAGLAELLFLTGREEESRQQYIKLLRNHPDDRRALLALVFIEKAHGNLEQSVDYLEKLLSSHYSDRLVHVLASQFYFDVQDWPAAETQLNQLKLWPGRDNWQEDWLRARISMARGRLDEAGLLLRALLQENSTVPLLWYTSAEVAKQQGRMEEAVTSMNTAARLAPEVQLYRLASEQLAIRYLDTEHPLRKQLAKFQFDQGALAEKRGYPSQASRHRRRATRLQPTNLNYWLASAQTALRQKHFSVYLEKLKHRQQLFPGDPLREEIDLAESSITRQIHPIEVLAEEKTFRYPLQIVALPSKDRNRHASLSAYLAYCIQDQLAPLDKLRFVDEPIILTQDPGPTSSSRDSELFILKIQVQEAGLSLQLSARIYLGRSEETLSSARFEVPKLRIGDLGGKVSRWIDQLLPPLATVVEQKFDQVLLQRSWWEGLDSPQVWTIIGSGRPELSAKFPYLLAPEKVEGQVEVQLTDGKLARGQVKVEKSLGMSVQGSLLVPMDYPAPSVDGLASRLPDPAVVFLRDNVLSW